MAAMTKRGRRTKGTHERTILGDNITARREAVGWTQDDLKRASGVPGVAMIESGARKRPSIDTIIRIATALKTDAETLYGGTSTPGEKKETLDAFRATQEGSAVTDAHAELLLRVAAPLAKMTITSWLDMWRALGPSLGQETKPSD